MSGGSSKYFDCAIVISFSIQTSMLVEITKFAKDNPTLEI